MMDHITLTSIYMIFHIISSSTSRTNTYLTVSTFFIDEIANSMYSFIDSSPSADITSFDIGLRLIELNKSLRKSRQIAHLTRCLSEDIAYARRRIRLGDGS